MKILMKEHLLGINIKFDRSRKLILALVFVSFGLFSCQNEIDVNDTCQINLLINDIKIYEDDFTDQKLKSKSVKETKNDFPIQIHILFYNQKLNLVLEKKYERKYLVDKINNYNINLSVPIGKYIIYCFAYTNNIEINSDIGKITYKSKNDLICNEVVDFFALEKPLVRSIKFDENIHLKLNRNCSFIEFNYTNAFKTWSVLFTCEVIKSINYLNKQVEIATQSIYCNQYAFPKIKYQTFTFNGKKNEDSFKCNLKYKHRIYHHDWKNKMGLNDEYTRNKIYVIDFPKIIMFP